MLGFFPYLWLTSTLKVTALELVSHEFWGVVDRVVKGALLRWWQSPRCICNAQLLIVSLTRFRIPVIINYQKKSGNRIFVAKKK